MAKRPLRFLMITTFYPPYSFGGDGNYVRQLAHVLAGMGHRVDVIHDVDAYQILSSGDQPEPLEEPEGIKVYGLKSRVPLLSCLATQQLGIPLVHGRTIRKILNKGQYDVIHYHNISLVGGPGILAYGDNAVKLYTAHEHWLVCPTHILWRYDREVCKERHCLRCQLSYRRPPQLWRYFGWLERNSRFVDAFCSPSQFSIEKHKEFGFETEMRVLPSFLPDGNTNDRDSTQTLISTAPHHRPFYVYVGRLELIKGIQDIIPHFLHNAPADLLIAGSGNCETELRQMAGDSEHIHFLGWRNTEQLKQLYRHALAAILPSACYEVFPLVVLEAFSESTPIITRAIGPYPEIVRSTNAGIVFESDAELKQALTQLAGDTQLRNTMGEAGLTAYKERWSETPAMVEYLSVISEIAEKRGLQKTVEAIEPQQSVWRK